MRSKRLILFDELNAAGNLVLATVCHLIDDMIASNFCFCCAFRDSSRTLDFGGLHLIENRRIFLHFWDRQRHKCHFDAGFSLRILKFAGKKLNFCAAFMKRVQQTLSLVGIGVADGFGVQQAANFAAILHQLNRMKQMCRALVEGRVHNDEIVALVSPVVEKIVMNDAKSTFFKLMTEIWVDFDAVKINHPHQPLNIFWILPPYIGVSAHFTGYGKRNITLASGWFKRTSNCIPVDAIQQLFNQRRRRWIKILPCFIGFKTGNHVHVCTSLLCRLHKRCNSLIN